MAELKSYSFENLRNGFAEFGSLGVVKNGGKGSGNFGHSGRPGEVGGSGKGDYHKDLLDTAKADMMYATEKYDKAIEDGDQSAIEEADAERVRTEEFYDKLKREMEEKGQSKSKEKKSQERDYKAEQEGVDVRDGYRIGTEFADLQSQLSTARTNLKMLKKDSGKSYDDLAGRNRYLTRQSEIARAFSQARALGKTELSKETKKIVKEMESELRSIMADYTDLGTRKYFDPNLNVER